MQNICITNGSQIVVRFKPYATNGDILDTVFVITTSSSISYNSMSSPTGLVSANTITVPLIESNVYNSAGELIEDNSEEIMVIVNVLDKDSEDMKVYLTGLTPTNQQTTADDTNVFDINAKYNLFRGCEGVYGDDLGSHLATQELDMADFFILNEYINTYECRY